MNQAVPDAEALKESVIGALRNVYDPEIPVNIYDLGLVYDIDVDPLTGQVQIRMTLTSPNCPEAQTLPLIVEQQIEALAGVSGASVEIVWDPPWSPERMSEAVRLELGLL